MLLAPHFLAGAAVAAQFSNPALGLASAFLSHFVLDHIPHWEYSIEPIKEIKTKGIKYAMPVFRRVALDISSGFAVLALAANFGYNDHPIWAWTLGGFFGILPDGLTFLLFKQRGVSGLFCTFLKLFFLLHRKIHYSKEAGLPPLRIGLGTQAIAVLLALYFLIF